MRDTVRWVSAAAVALGGVATCSPGDEARSPLMHIVDERLELVSADGHPLWGVRDLARLNGEYWALTESEPFVHVFGVDGVRTAAFGTLGDGPEELRSPRALWPGTPPGTMSVWDFGHARVATFAREGTLVESRPVPIPGVVRTDMDDVTFGDPFRAFQEADGSIVLAHYDSPVTHPNHFWNGQLVRVGSELAPAGSDSSGEVETIMSFARDLPGANRRPDGNNGPFFLGPVPLWDGCPDGRIAVLDAVASTMYFSGPSGSFPPVPDSLVLPWRPEPLPAQDRLAYIRHQMKMETRGQNVDESEIEALAAEAARRSQDMFPSEAPVAVDLRCGPNRIWLQEYDGSSSPLGYGAWWRTAQMDERPSTRFTRVVFPPEFVPLRFLETQVLGTVANSAGLERLAVAQLSNKGES